MASNSKLNSFQKSERKILLQDNPAVTIVNNGQTTIAYMLKGNAVQFSLNVMSPEEKKFRRKVGEYYAILGYHIGARVSMEKYDFANMLEQTFNLPEQTGELLASFRD